MGFLVGRVGAVVFLGVEHDFDVLLANKTRLTLH